MTVQALVACPVCDLLHQRKHLPTAGTARCSRCGSVLYHSAFQSLDRPLALTLAAIVLLVLANAFPFISFSLNGQTEQAILASGVMNLYDAGWVGLAVLVLLTGILIPLMQLIGLAYVLLALRLGYGAPHLAVIYRWVRHLQPWAMTDIFMLGIFVSVAKLAGMGNIMPGVSLYAFIGLMFILPAASAALNPECVWERLPIKAVA